MAYRRRRNRGSWLPLDPTFYSDSIVGTTFYQDQGVLDLTTGEGLEVFNACIPVAQDLTKSNDGTDAGGIMRDLVEGQEYFLDRIVGKVWAAAEQFQGGDGGATALFGMGFAVLPIEDGTAAPPGPRERDVFAADNAMAPWIWRRTWVLCNLLSTDLSYYYPNNTGAYGSVMDGGHVDAKTRRRIRKEERLFLCINVRQLSPEFPATMGIDFGFDLRIHGGMRKARNMSSFK